MFTLPELPYAYNALEPFIDEQTMRIHHDKHHAAYVKNLNDALAGQEKLLNMPILELMKDINSVPQEIRTKVKNMGGGHANHSLFWEIMRPNKGGEPSGELADSIKKTFGGFGGFKELFTKAAMGRFGSGWAWLVVDGGKLHVIDTSNQDNPWMEGKTPILGIDVWEHAYYLKYQNKRDEYISNWWNVVSWDEVGKRYGEGK